MGTEKMYKEKMYLHEPRNSENEAANDLDRTEIRKICQETNSCSLFTGAEIIGLTFGGLGLVLDFSLTPKGQLFLQGTFGV